MLFCTQKQRKGQDMSKPMKRKQAPRKERRAYGETLKILIETIERLGENTTFEDVQSVLEMEKRRAQQWLHKQKQAGYIAYDTGYTNMRIVKYPPSMKKHEEIIKQHAKALYEWKQKEYLKLYLDGVALVNGTTLKSSDRVKQNDINYKVLSRIDDPIVLEVLQQGE